MLGKVRKQPIQCKLSKNKKEVHSKSLFTQHLSKLVYVCDNGVQCFREISDNGCM